MDELIRLVAGMGLLVLLDLLAMRYGVDSRDGIGDDRARRFPH